MKHWNATHEMSRTRLYRIWCKMKERCYRPDNDNYSCYGGRGIKVCDEWHDSSAFFEWALANGYRDDLEIDRIDSDKNYAPNNCRWTTHQENCNNTRLTHKLTIGGTTKSIYEWALETGLKHSTIYARYKYYGKIGNDLISPPRGSNA